MTRDRMRPGVGRTTVAGLTGLVIVMVVLALLAPNAPAAAAFFSDVPQTHPFYDAISDLASRGVIGGYTDGRFGPDDPVNRQQFAKMIVLAGGYPVSEADMCPFGDVATSGGASLFPDNYVAVCAARGITKGKTTTLFDPYNSITRLQVVSMVVRAADDLKQELLAQTPAGWQGTTAWTSDPTHGLNAARAEFNGLLDGLDLALSPRGPMTRGEVAQVLFGLLGKLEAAAEPKIVTLTVSVAEGNGTFLTSPDRVTFTRGESVTITAVPAPGLAFAGWSGVGLGDADAFANPLTIVLEGDISLSATFGAPNTTFSDLGGVIASAPAVCSRGYGLMDVFARSSSGTLLHKSSTALGWSAWDDLGGAIKPGSDPAAVSWGTDRLDVFTRGTDDALWHIWWNGSTWSDWERLGGTLTAGPAAAYRRVTGSGSYLEVFVVDATGRLLQRTFDGSAWSDWSEITLKAGLTPKAGASLSAVTWGNLRVDLFVRSSEGGLWHRYLPPGGSWMPWESLGGDGTSNCSASTWGSWAEGQLDLWVRRADNSLWQRSLVSGMWSSWRAMNVGIVASAPAAVSTAPEQVDVFVRGTDGDLWHKAWTDRSWEL